MKTNHDRLKYLNIVLKRRIKFLLELYRKPMPDAIRNMFVSKQMQLIKSVRGDIIKIKHNLF